MDRLHRINRLAAPHALERRQRYLGRTVEVLVELRNLAYVDHAWALRFEQLRHRDAEKLVKGVLDYVAHSRVSARR